MRMLSKRFLALILALTLMFSLAGCGKGTNTVSQNTGKNEQTQDVTIVTSFYPMYIFTKNITKDVPGVTVANMTEPQTGCLHDYTLRPADMKLLEDADIFVANGAGMESFMDKILEQMPDLKIVEASKGMELLKEEEHEQEEAVNPHVWVSISGAISEVKNIGEQLSRLDPDHAEKYGSNMEEYIKKLEAQKGKMHLALKDIKTKDIVTFHEAFPYFAKEFDLDIVSVIEREPGTEPGAGELADIIQQIKESKVKVLFAEPQYSAKAAETISRETGAKVYILDPAVTGPKDANPDDYIKIMDKNLQVLLEALN